MITDPNTGETTVTVGLQIEIIGNDKVPVPGCEPTTEITSVTLSRERAKVCKNVVVDLQEALDAIPGSRIEIGYNWGQVRKRWFVLPPVPLICCTPSPDYYKILRELPSAEEIEESRFSECETLGQGYCPSGDFRLTPRPVPPVIEPDPYIDEGMPSPGPGFYTP